MHLIILSDIGNTALSTTTAHTAQAAAQKQQSSSGGNAVLAAAAGLMGSYDCATVGFGVEVKPSAISGEWGQVSILARRQTRVGKLHNSGVNGKQQEQHAAGGMLDVCRAVVLMYCACPSWSGGTPAVGTSSATAW